MTLLAAMALAAALIWPRWALMLVSLIVLGLFTGVFMTVFFLVGIIRIFGLTAAGFVAGVIATVSQRARRSA